ncbi:MAG: hypothetical protein OFPII_38210 [Osedax symbiont Rs1]|nr:MAG: hypothetical protein OFPII_38210 [Osedax symbiont Rs1]
MKPEKKGLFDSPKNVKSLLRILYICCIFLLILEFYIDRHITHSWEKLWGFYPLYGFVGCVVLVIVATWMRSLVMRDEDYYSDENSAEPLENNRGNTRETQQKSQSDGGGGQDVDE